MNQAIAVVFTTNFSKASHSIYVGGNKMFRTSLICVISVLMHFSSIASDKLQPIHKALDRFHQAAANANAQQYFELMTENSVFIGTDGSERWTKSEFKAFAKPYFDAGKGWLYSPRNRHVFVAKNGQFAWFDEMLDNQSYGECRGTGVLELTKDGWKISQYHLTIPIPNALAKSFVQQIKQLSQQP
ncbi:nuclear transport factor 2 family protein [Paraglaciecola aestuariivivens]